MASSAWRLTKSAARSSRLHWLATQSCSLVLLEASVTTSSCSSGGKAPRPTRPRSILQTGEPMLAESVFAKETTVLRLAAKLVGHLQIGRLIGSANRKISSAAEDQSLRRGMGSGQRLQPSLCIDVQDNRRSKWVWHDRHPCREIGIPWNDLPV